MELPSMINKSNPHQRTIIHLDMDYFYAQVEEIRDPTLRTKPLGIQQKNIVVTCNYVARQFGVKKLMTVIDAQRLCPTLVLVNGEDLTPYRQMSQRIFELLLNFTPSVEKLGFDEDFIDVTELVRLRMNRMTEMGRSEGEMATGYVAPVEGFIYPANGMALSSCDCGCAQRLAFGTQLAAEIRAELHSKLGVTCCAGISYNKLLAKLVGAQNKPNQQTVLVSSYAEEFMRELGALNRITGIGQKTESLLLESGIANVEELQNCDMDCLRKKFGFETATRLKDISFGRDNSAVRASGKPKTIGLEDSCKPISVRTDVEERFRLLLMRLVEQVAEDGRIPVAIKVVLRKLDPHKKTSHRETKQANILPSLFKAPSSVDTGGAKVVLADGAQEKLLKIIMRLFERVVDLNKPFNITLIGLAFSKFQQRKVGSASIANFLIKKTDLEVQSITSLTNIDLSSAAEGGPAPSISPSANYSDEAFRSSPTTFQPSDQFYRRRTAAASPIPMLVDNGSESAATNSDFSDFSETEVEPSPKKSRIGRLLMAKRRCLSNAGVCSSDAADVASPSKLRVCDLRLNSRDSEKDFASACSSTTSTNTTTSLNSINSSTTGQQMFNVHQRFRTIQPPSTLLTRSDTSRLHASRQMSISPLSAVSSPLPSPMDESCIIASSPTPPVVAEDSENRTCASIVEISQAPSVTSATITSITGNLSNIPCPAGVDAEVFNELPIDVQNELIASWRSSLSAAAAAAAVTNNSATGPVSKGPTTGGNAAAARGLTAANGTQKNTLYRYFLRNK